MVKLLYTSYLAQLDKLPDDIGKLVITRYPPGWVNFDETLDENENGTCLAKPLSPGENILNDYKQDGDWSRYVRRFKKQMETWRPTVRYIEALVSYMDRDNDIILLCFEKDYKRCHRSLVAQKVEELVEKDIWSTDYEVLEGRI